MASESTVLSPLEAYRQIMRFSGRRGENALRLALHAAVPQVLRADLLHLLRLNFVPESLDDTAVEADVLFAPFCENLGNGYYRFEQNVRRQLLNHLDPTYENDMVLRSQQVASFLLAYFGLQSRSIASDNDHLYGSYLEVERWVALAFLDPASAATQLAAAVRHSCDPDEVTARMQIGGLTSALSTPLAPYQKLLAYAAGIEALNAGQVEQAYELLDGLGDSEIRVGEITLRSARSVLSEYRRILAETAEPKVEADTVESTAEKPLRDHFFISYDRADRAWAEWIAWQLEQAGHQVKIQAWDFAPGRNFLLEMQKTILECERTIAVLSPNYFSSEFAEAEWATAFRLDPTGKNQKLIPVRIEVCQPPGLLGSLIYIDLVGLDEQAAERALLDGLKDLAGKPTHPPPFPSRRVGSIVRAAPFPPNVAKARREVALSNLPDRNLFFTDRETVLAQLQEAFARQGRVTLSGLGGVGKTQTALEYAHRHLAEYANVFWAIATSPDALLSSYVAIAGLLKLPEADAQDQTLAVGAVKRWLNAHDGWLLILDNADDLEIVDEFIPPEKNGHVLLTTRARATGAVARLVEIQKMGTEESALFLLRRAKYITEDAPLDAAAEADQGEAKAIAAQLDGLPLALDQAGAYIEETGCGLSGFISLYRTHGPEFLRRRGTLTPDHPDPVAATRTKVFISYSHKDATWRKDLEMHLKPYLREGSITSWSDEQILAGSKWFGEIQSALSQAKVAVLLVSPDFLGADFVYEYELGPLLKEATRGGVKILWVPIRDSAYKKTPLKDYQAVLDPSKPLASMTKARRGRAWIKVCEEIEAALKTGMAGDDT
jgi:TIR domain-containing protein/NB-ARC domain-containing protein